MPVVRAHSLQALIVQKSNGYIVVVLYCTGGEFGSDIFPDKTTDLWCCAKQLLEIMQHAVILILTKNEIASEERRSLLYVQFGRDNFRLSMITFFNNVQIINTA